jgi:hypothetical protein
MLIKVGAELERTTREPDNNLMGVNGQNYQHQWYRDWLIRYWKILRNTYDEISKDVQHM